MANILGYWGCKIQRVGWQTFLGVRWQKCFEDGEETNIWHVVANIYGDDGKTFFSIVEWKTNLGCDGNFWVGIRCRKNLERWDTKFLWEVGCQKMEWGYTHFLEVGL